MQLKFDNTINAAARAGDNDEAREEAVNQRYFYENLCDDHAELSEWRRRQYVASLAAVPRRPFLP